MPNYSKARTLFSSTNKNLWDIPWAEVHEMYVNTRADMYEEKQEEIDEKYREEIDQLEREYTASHEAPYEGNFSDSTPKPSVHIGFEELEKRLSSRIRSGFIEKYKLVHFVDWMFPQIITWLGRQQKYKNDEGKYCGLLYRNNNFKTDAEKGLYRFLMVNERSSYLKTQYKDPHKQYSSLVPIILYAHRLIDQTPYSEWDRETLDFVVNSDLAAAMKCTVPAVTREELIETRRVGLLDSSGKPKNPVTTHDLYGREQKASAIGDLPKLAKVMLTQIWVAHPDNRTRYMVLNPKNWDKMPPQLIESDVVKSTQTSLSSELLSKRALLDDF